MIEVRLEGRAKNALSTEVMTRLEEALGEAGGRPVLLTGAGDAFSAGLDLKEIAGLDPDGMLAFLRRLGSVVEALFRYPGPTVAAVNGHAIAGGCVIAAACDHRVGPTDPRAMLGLNEVALGLRFPPGILEILRYRIARLEPVVLGSALMDPARALSYGLLDELADDPVAVGRQRLAALAALPAAAYASTKRDLRGPVRSADAEAERRFLADVLPVWTSPELRTRIAAFLERKR
ncbi:MAG: enoyl-CoA hydratase/isomerase family protein [Myxococcota bacterium]